MDGWFSLRPVYQPQHPIRAAKPEIHLRRHQPCTSFACRLKREAYNELLQRAERQGKVARAASRMAYDKQAMGKGRKRKLAQSELEANGAGDCRETVYKWKRERKK